MNNTSNGIYLSIDSVAPKATLEAGLASVRQKTAKLPIFRVNDGIRLVENHRIWPQSLNYKSLI